MTFLPEISKLFLITGVLFIILGVFLALGGRIPYLGKLPGDIIIEREDFHFYFPITTSLLISFLLTFIFWLSRFLRE